MRTINSVHLSIAPAKEVEASNGLAYLDVFIERAPNVKYAEWFAECANNSKKRHGFETS